MSIPKERTASENSNPEMPAVMLKNVVMRIADSFLFFNNIGMNALIKKIRVDVMKNKKTIGLAIGISSKLRITVYLLRLFRGRFCVDFLITDKSVEIIP